MATTQTYKCISNNAPIKSRPSFFASNLGTLKKDSLIEVISINGLWAYFKYNKKDAYILTNYIQKVQTVVTGSTTIRYLNTDTKAEISAPVTNSNLTLKSYTYTAPSIANYTVVEPSSKSVTLTATNPNQEVIFYYKENKIYGSITINYIDKDTGLSIAPSETHNNIELGTYSYNSIAITGYKLASVSSQSVTLTKDTYNQTITFEYSKILGNIYIKYVDVDTKVEIATTESYSNLELKAYSYKAKSIDGYTVVEPTSKTITLTSTDYNQNVVFYYKANKVYGSVSINYVEKGTSTTIAPSVINNNLELGTYSYKGIDIDGYQITDVSSKSVTLTKEMPDQSISFEYTKNPVKDPIYVIDLKKYGISNDNTNANATTIGINKALVDAKDAGYKRVKLPEGHYSIEVDTTHGTHIMPNTQHGWNWTHNQKGIIMRDNITLDLTNCILNMIPSQETHYSLITFSGCNNATLIGGTLIGDRYTHDYGQRINDNGNNLEKGGFDEKTGLPIENTSQIRTLNYIDTYKTGDLPRKFRILPLEGTNFSTTDGGRCFVYCYDNNNNFLGTCHGGGWGGYLEQITLIENTKKIKISFWNEDNLKSKYYITTLDLYYTLEWGSGIIFTDAQNCTVKDTKIIDFIGDCVGTNCPPCDYNNYNLQLIGCTLENSRRQGISLTGDSEIFIVKDCNIGYINGVDPQCGVDIETETGSARKVLFDNCHFYMNKRADFDNFNGVDTEIKNCTFNGSIASIYGNGLKVHDNIFEYKLLQLNQKNSHLVCNTSGVGFSGKDNECYNNTFIGEKTGVHIGVGENNKIYNNTIKDGATLTTRIETYGNKYYNSNAQYGVEIEGDGTSTVAIYNEEFNNSTIQNMLTINDSVFNDSDIYCQGSTNTSIINNCDLNFTTSQFLKTTSGGTYFKNCNFTIHYNDSKSFMPNVAGTRTFNSCNFNMGVTQLIGLLYGKLTMNTCTFYFDENYGSTNNIDSFIGMGYTGSFNLTNNKYYKTFDTPTILLPPQTGIIVNDEAKSNNSKITI